MPDEEKKQEEQEEQDAPKEKSKLKGPLLFGIIGIGVFVIAIGGFSFMMGVFSSPPATEGEAGAAEEVTDTTQAEDHAKSSDSHELDALEAEIFGVESIGDAADIDDLVKLAENRRPGISVKDSLKARRWLDEEKATIVLQRAELDSIKKDISRQEYRLKQVIAKTDQMESARVNALAKLYDGMKPSQVAPLIKKLTEEQAVEILLKMKPANASKIFGAISPDYAARISARMITLTEE